MTKSKGSFTLEESLSRLIMLGEIEREEALAIAVHPDDLQSMLKAAWR